jgi:signal transduction histidine kinase/CheY-like chemotaxis protein
LICIQLFLLASLTTLPGRVLRNKHSATKQLLIQKQAYVRFVSHEVRSPLAVVSAGLELLLPEISKVAHNVPALSTAIELTKNISVEAESAIQILNDLLFYEAIDAGMLRIEESRANPSDLFEGLHQLRMITQRRSQTLLVNMDEEVPAGTFIFVDIHRIEQVIRNLVTNASKFTPEFGIVSIRVTFEINDAKDSKKLNYPKTSLNFSRFPGYLRIKVLDNGEGISSEKQMRITEQFEHFDKNSLQSGGGSGLGLWISFNIINRHGGRLGFKSDGEHKGSEFFFDLPIFSKVDSQSMIPKVATTSTSSNSNGTSCSIQIHPEPIDVIPDTGGGESVPEYTMVESITSISANLIEESASTVCPDAVKLSEVVTTVKKSLRVLIVDDVPSIRKMIRKILESEDAIQPVIVREAGDGTEALSSIKEDPDIDCIFIDSVMRVVHGPEAVQKLRIEVGYSGVIIGVTGNAMREDVQFFMESGLNKIVLKPFKRSDLIGALRETHAIS